MHHVAVETGSGRVDVQALVTSPPPGRSRPSVSGLSRRPSGDAAADRFDSGLYAVLEVELGEDARDVVRHRIRAERELTRDLGVAVAAGQKGEDLKLPAGQGRTDRHRGPVAVLDRNIQFAD